MNGHGALEVRLEGLRRGDESGARAAPLGQNPLLRSGLGLAGANKPSTSSGDDGILTALEVSSLDLRGTKLAVLSACETAVDAMRMARRFDRMLSRMTMVLGGCWLFIMLLAGRVEAETSPAPAATAAVIEDPPYADPLRFGGSAASLAYFLPAASLSEPDHLPDDDPGDLMALDLSMNYYPIWKGRHQFRIGTSVGLTVDTAAYRDTVGAKNAVAGSDLPILLGYVATVHSAGDGYTRSGPSTMFDPTLLGPGDWRTWFFTTASLSFPTTERSQGAGVGLVTSFHTGLRQRVNLLGAEAVALRNILVTASLGWTHTPLSPPTQLGLGVNRPFPNTLSYSVDVTLHLVGGLELSTGLGLRQAFRSKSLADSLSCDIIVSGQGCVDVVSSASASQVITLIPFDCAFRSTVEMPSRFSAATAITSTPRARAWSMAS